MSASSVESRSSKSTHDGLASMDRPRRNGKAESMKLRTARLTTPERSESVSWSRIPSLPTRYSRCRGQEAKGRGQTARRKGLPTVEPSHISRRRLPIRHLLRLRASLEQRTRHLEMVCPLKWRSLNGRLHCLKFLRPDQTWLDMDHQETFPPRCSTLCPSVQSLFSLLKPSQTVGMHAHQIMRH